MAKQKVINTTRAQLAESFFYLNGVPMSLADYPHMRLIYNMTPKNMVLKFSRQTSKSTTMAAIMAADAIMRSKNPNAPGSGGFQQMYISPTVDQTKIFSHDRINPILEGSPFVKRHFLDSKLIQNVFMKQLKNGSKMYLRYALLNADRLRGYCLLHDHEYLTKEKGWIPVKDIQDTDILLTKNETTNVWEWQKPTKIIEQYYKGPIDIYTAKGFKCRVTQDHRMHLSFDVRADHNYKDKILPLEWQTDYKSKDLHNRNFKLGIGDENQLSTQSKTPEFFELPAMSTNLKADGAPYADGKFREYPAIKLPMKPFMRWMGWWLAEGWTSKNAITIGVAQSKSHNFEHWEEIDNLCSELFPYHTKIDTGIETWALNSEYRTLYEWLKKLGKSGDKYIPELLLEYTDYLPDLLDGLYKGDGDNCTTYKKTAAYKDHLRLNTKSLKLANTVQTAWLLLGKLSSIRHRDREPGRIYTVEVKAKTYFNFYLNRPSCSGNIASEQYGGKIYCVQTPNKNFVARHSIEKMPFVTGNSVDKICYDKDTEVLTNQGWKLFKDLDKTELIPTLNPETSQIEFHRPTDYIAYHHQGEMIEYTHNGFKLSVTPDHKMLISQELNTGYYKNPKRKGWFEESAENTIGMNFKIGVQGTWEGSVTEEFVISGYETSTRPNGEMYKNGETTEVPEFRAPLQPFMKFMGWWLAEGSTSKTANQIQIPQKEGINANKIREILQDLPIQYGESIQVQPNETNLIYFYFSNRALADYLRKVGTSFIKSIPRELLVHKKYLLDLLQSLYDGDAMRHKNDINEFGELNTASKEMANTVQEAWLRIGRQATIRQITEKSGTIMYRVRPLQRPYIVFWNNTTNKSEIKRIPYDDTVYCITVPNHIIFVRNAVEKKPVCSVQCYDEVQDLYEKIMPVADQAMSRSYYKERIFSGTPKLTQGTLANLWQRSTMNEFMLKCNGCNKWNILDEKNIGLKGLICKHCGKGLNPRNGQWVSTAPPENAKYNMVGFRVCALHFYGAPWVDWQDDILLKYETEAPNLFFNETLGLEYDDGVNPITENDIRDACTGGPMLVKPDLKTQASATFIGIDYGPINSTDSYTVIVVLQKVGSQIRILHAKKYEGREADFAYIHKDIASQFHHWKAVAIGADHGMGEASNSELRNTLGPHRVIALQHQANQKEEVRWNSKMNAYTLARTQIMTRFFSDIKKGKFIFPQWEDWEPFAKDLLAPVVDYDDAKTKMFYVNSRPDDIFHAIIYGTTVLELLDGMISW
jgi:hypothetical protein